MEVKRIRNETRIAELREERAWIRESIKQILKAGVKSYNIGSRALTKLDLPWLYDRQKDIDDELAAEQGQNMRFRYVVAIDK